MDDQLRRIEAKLDQLASQVGETHTAMFTRGGAFDRLDAVEKRADEVATAHNNTKAELDGIKGKVAFAAACASSLVAIAWALISKFWNPHN